MKLLNTYANLSWTVEDVQSVDPHLTDEEAEEFLQRYQKKILLRMTEFGFEVIKDMLDDENISTKG